MRRWLPAGSGRWSWHLLAHLLGDARAGGDPGGPISDRVQRGKPLPVTHPARLWRAAMALVLVLGGAGCGSSEPRPSADRATDAPTDPASDTAPTPTPAGTAASTSPAPLVLADAGWYEVDRVGDLEGNESRTLLVGSLGGTLVDRVPLAAQGPADRRDGLEP